MPWETTFELGRRVVQESDVVPYWLFPGDAKVPSLKCASLV